MQTNFPVTIVKCTVSGYLLNFQSSPDIYLVQGTPDEIVLKINATPKKMNLNKPKQKKPTDKKPDSPKDHWVDKGSRVLFPTLYAIFLVAYTAHYKSKIVD